VLPQKTEELWVCGCEEETGGEGRKIQRNDEVGQIARRISTV
jgi:hypothetical protein